MHARYFSANLGRFLSFDAADGDSWRPQSWNRYSYVLGNPVKYTDPRGESPFEIAGQISQDYLQCVLNGGCEFIEVTDKYNPLTGVEGLGDLINGRGLLSEIDSGLASTRVYYQNRFELQVARGNEFAAFLDYAGLELFIPEDSSELGIQLAVMLVPEGKLGELLGKPAAELITGSLKRSKSYRSELEHLTYPEIVRLSKGKGPVAQGARQMKKLIEQSERLIAKVKGKFR